VVWSKWRSNRSRTVAMRPNRPSSDNLGDVEEALRQLLSRVHLAQERLSEQVALSACAEAAALQETSYEEAGLSDPEQFYRDEGKEEKEGKAAEGPATSALVPDSLRGMLADGLERADITGQRIKHK
jgi:hypothetical protein